MLSRSLCSTERRLQRIRTIRRMLNQQNVQALMSEMNILNGISS